MAFWDALQARGPAHAVMDDGNAPSAAQPSASGDGGPGGPGGSSVRTGSQLLDLLVDELQMEPAQIDKLEACRKVRPAGSGGARSAAPAAAPLALPTVLTPPAGLARAPPGLPARSAARRCRRPCCTATS